MGDAEIEYKRALRYYADETLEKVRRDLEQRRNLDWWCRERLSAIHKEQRRRRRKRSTKTYKP